MLEIYQGRNKFFDKVDSKAEQKACLGMKLHRRETLNELLCTKLECGPSPINNEWFLNQGGFH